MIIIYWFYDFGVKPTTLKGGKVLRHKKRSADLKTQLAMF
nr:MAG TPA: hypothetical protein [Caudoviricetes sp.]